MHLIIERASRYPRVPLIRNSIFARNVPFSQTRSHITSDTQIKGLQKAGGKTTAEQLLHGCKVHWIRSCQRVADRVSSSEDKSRERKIFLKSTRCVPSLANSIEVVEALCGVRPIMNLLEKVQLICAAEDAVFVDEHCDWSVAKHWAQGGYGSLI